MGKKFFRTCCICFFILTMLMPSVVNAGSINIAEDNIVVMDELNEEDFAEENYRLIALGERLSYNARVSAQKVLSIPRLAQNDPSWKDEVMQTEKATIEAKGCYLTSFTMVQRYYGGSLDPAGVNSVMGNFACPFYRNTAASKFGYTITSYMDSGLTESNIINYVKGAITENVPVIVALNKPGGGNHFVVAKGYLNDVIVISDPGPLNYTSLAQYFSNGYTIRSVVCFKK